MGGTTEGDSVMSRPPNIFILLLGSLLLVAMSHASEENQIIPSNILEISPSISEQMKDTEDDPWNIMEQHFMDFSPSYFGGRGFKTIGNGNRQKRFFGLSPFSSFQQPKAVTPKSYYRRPNRNDRLQVIRLKKNNLHQMQHLGESLKVIRL